MGHPKSIISKTKVQNIEEFKRKPTLENHLGVDFNTVLKIMNISHIHNIHNNKLIFKDLLYLITLPILDMIVRFEVLLDISSYGFPFVMARCMMKVDWKLV